MGVLDRFGAWGGQLPTAYQHGLNTVNTSVGFGIDV